MILELKIDLYIRPWSKEADNILKMLSKNGRAYTKDTKSLPKQFGLRCKEPLEHDMLDIATIRNKKEKKTWFIIPPDIKLIPNSNKKGISYHFKRFDEP